jgi:diacylglycerol kinase family enzyme
VLGRRLWALGALLLAIAAVALAVATTITRFPRGLSVLACIALALLAVWHGVRRRGLARRVALFVAILLLAGAIALVVTEGTVIPDLVVLALAIATVGASRRAFAHHVHLAPGEPPSNPVLFYNPKSGGGKAERFHLPDEARRRGIEPIELRRGDDLEELVRSAVERGANGLAMAGGDGSQAVVAQVASELDLPYACIPSGTRNHFALDLGVDRDDVVGALDAFVDGGERRVDLAEVNGRVFVNNVSLGLYAEAVQQPGYRDAKLGTLLATVPDAMGPDAKPPKLDWMGPHGRSSGVAILVSNNRYRLGPGVGAGTRPRLDRGELGIAVLSPIARGDGDGAGDGAGDGDTAASRPQLGMHQWTDDRFRIQSEEQVPAGIDGEAVVLESPLRFRSLPGALRVRIAPAHPGASPSAVVPDSLSDGVLALMKLAAGQELTQ